MKRFAAADLLLPGAGLVVDGRLAWGVPLLVPAVLLLSALLLGLVVGGFAAAWIMPRALPPYLLLAVLAALVRWRLAARERIDPETVKRAARAAARAWLRGEADAVQHARAVVRAAPEMAQAWRLLALINGDARAARRAEAIDRRA